MRGLQISKATFNKYVRFGLLETIRLPCTGKKKHGDIRVSRSSLHKMAPEACVVLEDEIDRIKKEINKKENAADHLGKKRKAARERPKKKIWYELR